MRSLDPGGLGPSGLPFFINLPGRQKDSREGALEVASEGVRVVDEG